MSYINLEKEKKKLMNDMFEQLTHWTGEGIEETQKILAANNELIMRMKEIDKEFTQKEQETYNKKYQKKWASIIEKQEKLNQWIYSEKKKISEQLAQTQNREKVVSSYIGLQKESALISKNY